MNVHHEITEGDDAPNFRFKDENNIEKDLIQYKGKNIVLYFYPKDFTPGCTTEASEFAKDYEFFQEKNILILGVSPDNESSHKKFTEKMDLPFLLVSDSDNEIAKKYGVFGLKKFMGKEYMGIKRTTFLINKEGKIEKVFQKVKPKGHSKEVLDCFNQ
ncbi:MAG: thioredoxin-dependent thiol peroxidase [Nitrososphaeraceae archaeon]